LAERAANAIIRKMLRWPARRDASECLPMGKMGEPSLHEFGLASSALLTVLVIPAIYIVMRDKGRPLPSTDPQIAS
jgi:hypothetical protein